MFALALAGCGDAAERCDTSRPCATGLVCIDGACVSARDAGGRDAGSTSRDDASVDAAPVVGDAAAVDAALPGYGCSADLRSVLDATGLPIAECPAGQGCSEGVCIAACDAAAASRGTVACEFVVPTPPAYPTALPPCHAVFVANAWATAAHLGVERGGSSLDLTGAARIVDNATPAASWAAVPATGLPPGEVAVLFLSSDPNSVLGETGSDLSCPVTPLVDRATTVAGGGYGNERAAYGDAFRVGSDVPVRAYDIQPYGGAISHFPSASLLVPTSAWGTEYVVVDAPRGTFETPGPMWIQVVGGTDGTTVSVRASTAITGGDGLPSIAAGAEASFTIARGRYAHFEMSGDPTGTLIRASAPIGVVAGNRFLRLQTAVQPGGDSAHQVMLPVRAWSSEYVAAPHATRRASLAPEDVRYRIVGAYDGTTLTYEPPLAGAPATLGRGESVEVHSTDAFVVRAQDAMHPFAVIELMTTANLPNDEASRPGATATRFGTRLGDEEAVILFPPSQFLSSYVFFSDPSYPTTNLVLVRRRTTSADVPATTSVDCIGEVGGWRRVGASEYEWTEVDLVRAGTATNTCTNGRHTATSDVPFGMTVWGLDTYSSYAYPAGGNAQQLTELEPIF